MKAIKITVIILAAVLVILIITPVLFKDTLLQKTKSTLSQKLNVSVSFDRFNLSLIRNFPNASISLGNVLLSGKGAFQGDTLLFVGSLHTKFGLFDLFSPDNLTISELILDKVRLNLKVNKDNRANWDNIPENAHSSSKEKGSGTFTMELNRIQVNNALVTYSDVTIPLDLLFKDINMQIKGRMYGNNTDLKLEGEARQFDLTYDKINYISKTRLDVNTLLHIDFDKWNFVFSDAEARINGLPFGVQGNFSAPGDSIFYDLSFASKASLLADFLKLTPPAYTSYLKKLRADGKAELSGKYKGLYFRETYPALEVFMKVTDGKIHYEDLPGEITNINADLSILKPQGDFNLTVLAIRKVHAEIRNNPIDFNLRANNLLKDMQFSGSLTGKVNFDQLKEVIPLDNITLSGLMDVNLWIEGNMSAIQKKEYGLVKTHGKVSLNNFSYSGTQLTMPVRISSGLMDFSPQKITLQHMNMTIGQSDMALTGSLSDYYAYFLTNGTLNGNVSMNSGFLNLNELMQLQKSDSAKIARQKKTAAEAPATNASSFSVPDRISLILVTNINKALYEKLRISNIRGKVTVHNGRMDLNDLNMNLLNGELNLAGVYENHDKRSPKVNMLLNMVSFDIPTAFQSLPLIRKYIPIAAQSKGQFSTSIRLSGMLDNNMNLISESLNGSGLFNSFSVQILNSPVFNKIKSVLNENRLSDMKIDDFTAHFTIENGNLLLIPFKTKISGQEATFAGRLNADNMIDMDINFIINRDALSQNLENTLAFLPGQQNIQKIPVGVKISGPVKSPEVGIDLSQARSMVKKEVKNASKQEIKDAINKVGQGIKKLFK